MIASGLHGVSNFSRAIQRPRTLLVPQIRIALLLLIPEEGDLARALGVSAASHPHFFFRSACAPHHCVGFPTHRFTTLASHPHCLCSGVSSLSNRASSLRI